MKRDFNEWLSHFQKSISSYDYYIDFKKVYKNTEQIKVGLNIMNSLLGSKDIENEFENLLKRYPEILKCIPILIAKREMEIPIKDKNSFYEYHFDRQNLEIEDYKRFMKKTGLFDLIANHLISNLVDYVLGVETGLNSNERKNRGGHLMEDLVESFIQKSGFPYYKEIYLKDVQNLYNIDLHILSNNGKLAKRFDFVVKGKTSIYAIETNFYASGGSKLNETARSYKELAIESKNIPNFHFVWITDGAGWYMAKNNLEDTFDVLEHLYNIHDLENNILDDLFKEKVINS